MPIDVNSHGLWTHTAPPTLPAAPLRGEYVSDVVVIGAGFTGLSAALHLAGQGAKVHVLESMAAGYGGSGRNVGLVNAGMWLPPDAVCAAVGRHHGEALLSTLGQAPDLVFDLISKHQIECEAVRKGSLHCAANGQGMRDLQARAKQWQRLGAPVTLLDAAQTQRRLGSGVYQGSLLDQRAGTIQPLAYAHGLSRAAQAAGTTLCTNSAVLSVQQVGARWRVKTAHGAVIANWVIVATNAWSGDLWPVLQQEIVRVPYYQCATEPLDAAALATFLPGEEGTWDTRTLMRSLRRDRAGRMIFGGIGALRHGAEPLHRRFSARVLKEMFPDVKIPPFAYAWYGWIGMTTDHLPRFHELAPNVLSFHGYNGRGIGTGTMFGKIAADLILGKVQDAPLPPSRPQRRMFRRVQTAVYETGAALAHCL